MSRGNDAGRRKTAGFGLLLGLAALAAPAFAQSHSGVEAKLKDASGKVMGDISLVPGNNGMGGMINVKGLTPGEHGMHIHAIGKCDGEAFAGAGGHLNPAMKQHGLDNAAGAHDGDLPNLKVDAKGNAHQSFVAHTTLASILDSDGAAFVVHAGPDDQKTDPSGNSGGRVLCGVFYPRMGA